MAQLELTYHQMFPEDGDPVTGTPASYPTAAAYTRRQYFANQATCTGPAASKTATAANAKVLAPATYA